MILEQTISAMLSLALITIFVLLLFTIKFSNYKKRFLKSFYDIPSVIFSGPEECGKESIMTNITGYKTTSHPFENNLKIGYLIEGDKKIQLISIPYSFMNVFVNSEEFKKINKKLFVNDFDVSSISDNIDGQIRNFEKSSSHFDDVDKIIVANKIDIVDDKKLKNLKTKYKKIHETSSITKKGLEQLKSNILSKVK